MSGESEADIGYGSTIEVEETAGAGDFVELGEVKSIGLPNDNQEQADVTHMKSPGRTRERVPTLIDPGTMQVVMNWVPGSETDEFIVSWKASGERRSTRVTTPNAKTFTFGAFPTSYETPLEVEGVMTATLQLQVAGAVTRGG